MGCSEEARKRESEGEEVEEPTMIHQQPTDAIREMACLHALGAMSEDEARAYEEHLRGGCVVCRSEVDAFLASAAQLGDLATPVSPPLSLRVRVLESIASRVEARSAVSAEELQVWKRWGASETGAGNVVMRGSGGDWERTANEGVAVRRLFVDTERQMVTMLIRMDAGSKYPRHRHADAEECFVLQGELRVGDELVMQAGDYQRVGRDSVHEVQSTEDGCLLLIISSLHDEILA